MHCTNCGALLSDADRFCPNCGTPAAVPQPEPQPEPQTENAQEYIQPEPQPQPEQTYAPPQPDPQPQQTYTPHYTQNAYAQPTPTFYDCGVQSRDIAVAVILSIVTCGIYSIYWFIKMVDDVNRVANDQGAMSGGVTWLLTFVTCGIYGVYWYYQAAKKMRYAKQVRNMPADDNTEILYLLLSIFGFGFVVMCLIQSDLNKMATPAA